ncbi:hypothetical protein WMF45_38400 [Sorangium sp. So ce448]|uniref:hypothetical protein n=1 Tax=Sorangium sp. So ce448 TaxID=3133314 RepID=UPI003F60B3E3
MDASKLGRPLLDPLRPRRFPAVCEIATHIKNVVELTFCAVIGMRRRLVVPSSIEEGFI